MDEHLFYSKARGENCFLKTVNGSVYMFKEPDSEYGVMKIIPQNELIQIHKIVHRNHDVSQTKYYAYAEWKDSFGKTYSGYVSMQSQHLTMFDPVFAQHQEMSKKASKAVSGYYDF